ncbi:MAG: protein kinase [Polyangiaceae bacterium]|nr:protein kinase [Polyangiaceae bacterium]
MSGSPGVVTPARLGQYEILRRLGAGGMAEVFLARKPGAENTYKQLVIKRVLPHHGKSRRFQAMFVAEAQLATRLNHPNIVQVYDFEDIGEEGQLLTMEHVEGPDLGRVLSAARGRGVRLPPWVSAYIIAEAAKGLHYAHERKNDDGAPLAIVHRDVSPQNILLSWEGAVKIADFGIASANLFREEGGLLKGKFGYMSPEQAQGEGVDRRSDIYALGVCLHEMLTGRPLHGVLQGDELLEAVRRGVVEPPSTYTREIPGELEGIVMKALSREKGARFQTSRDLAGAIHRAMLARQELVDATALEAVLLQVPGRDPEPAAGTGVGSEGRPSTAQQTPHEEARGGEATGVNTAHDRQPQPRGAREVRHVAVVTMRLEGIGHLEGAAGVARAEYVLARLRETLEAIAYKRGAAWQWQGDRHAQAIVGLLANSSRAAVEAAWLAVDVHEAMDGASEDLEVPLQASLAIVRGVASGEREASGRLARPTLLPPAGYLAGLLGEQAPWGATWVAGGLYRMVRRDFRWGDAPLVEVPPQPSLPLPRALRVYALQRPLNREERAAEAALAPGDLVGRDAEKADLHAAYHRSVSPENGAQGAIISRAVVGEMGIGKSALVAAFLAELPPEARLLRHEASHARSDLPFSAIAALTREALGVDTETPADELKERLDELFDGQARPSSGPSVQERLLDLLLGRAEMALDADDLAFRRRQIGGAVRALLAELASRQPLVLVYDGLQWIDRPSLELIAELIRREDSLPILTLLLTRPDERVLGQLEGIVRLDLQGLSREDQIRLVEARLGVRQGVAAVCAELAPRVAGNPFFLLEMVDALLERGTLELQQAENGEGELVRVEQGQAPLPSTLEQILGDRLRELSSRERSVVEWLAVAGTPLTGGELQGLQGEDLEEGVSRLCARGLCDARGEQVDFRHTITRDVAYQDLDPDRRRELHRRFGEHLLAVGQGKGLAAATVAKHLARGGDADRAADLYLEAATTARQTYQTPMTVRYYQRALQLLPARDLRRLEAHEALEASFRVVGRRRDRKEQLSELRRLARASGQPRWVALALVRSARLDLDEGNLTHGINLARSAVEAARLARSPSLETEAQTIVSELLRELGDLPGALEACDAALAVAQRHRGITARNRADVLRSRGAILRRLGRVREAVNAYAEAIAIFRSTGARRMEARTRNSLAMAMLVSERWEDAIALALEAIQLDLSVGSRFQIAKTLTNIGMAYARMGDLPRAVAYLRRSREAHERYGDQDSLADTLLVSAEVVLDSGDSDAAHSFCTEASTLSSLTHNGYDAVHEKIVRALIARAHRDSTSAISCAFEARQEAESQALSSFHIYATSIEALSRVEAGDLHTGILLASTALGAVSSIPSEYGIEIRVFACEALARAQAPLAQEARRGVVQHLHETAERIRDPRLRSLFLQRPLLRPLLAPRR